MVIKKIITMILFRYMRFFGVFLSVKVFLKSLMTLLNDMELEVAEETLDMDCCRS
jgi:hypothetical protein